MTYELADDFPDFRGFPEDIGAPLARPRWGRRLHLVPDPEPSEAELALKAVEAELAAVRARGPVIAAVVSDLAAAVDRLVAEVDPGGQHTQ